MDYQKKKFYAWENREVKLPSPVPFEKAQALVDAIWMAKGLLYPPKVFPLHLKSTALGKAERNTIYLRADNTLHTVLHEIAHSMSDDGHGENFAGIFIDLCEQFGNIPKFMLWYSAERAGLKVNKIAKPVVSTMA